MKKEINNEIECSPSSSLSLFFSMQQVDEAVLLFTGGGLSLGLPLQALIDAVSHLLLTRLASRLLVLPCLPLPQVILNPASTISRL